MRIVVLAAALALSACVSTPQILVSQPGATSPAALESFAFRSSDAVVESGTPGRRADAQMRDKVVRSLASKGYVEAAAGTEPDFYVTYRVAVFLSESQRDTYTTVRDPTTLIRSDPIPDPAGSEGLVRQATLVLMAQSNTDDKVLWQAQASGVAASRTELTSGALRVASEMLRKFPDRAR